MSINKLDHRTCFLLIHPKNERSSAARFGAKGDSIFKKSAQVTGSAYPQTRYNLRIARSYSIKAGGIVRKRRFSYRSQIMAE